MEEKSKKKIKGIKIRNINIYMMMISCILYIFLIGATIYASDRYNAMISATEDYISCERDASLIMEGSDYLTEQVRLYTITMDIECMKDYFTEAYTVRRRDQALEHMRSFDVEEEIESYLQTALDYSNRLMTDEIYAMKLITAALEIDEESLPEDVKNMELTEKDRMLEQEEMIAQAREIVFGSSYQEMKALITDNISYFIDSIVDDTLKKQQNSALDLKYTMTKQQILISILFIENILMFLLIILLVIKPLKIYIENIEDKEKLTVSGSYEFKYLALTYNSIYELNTANEATLRYQAEHDPLTGIINRGAFDKLKQFFQLNPKPLAFLIIDVDKFKSINDGYGHEVGDKVLKKVARLLEESFRATDYPARIGGDEFAIIIADVSPDLAPMIQSKIAAMNETLMNPSDSLPKVSLSVGGAFSELGFTNDLYQRADMALYNVKEHGRCGCCFYEELEEQ